jgi:hypothetical protein
MRRFGISLLMATVVATLLSVSIIAADAAGKGGSRTTGGGYTVTVSPAGPYTFGQDVYTTTNAPLYPNNTGPWIDMKCVQNGVTVLTGGHAGFEAGWYYNWPWKLGPTQSWSGGAADCTVVVYHQQNNKIVNDATTSFHVNG